MSLVIIPDELLDNALQAVDSYYGGARDFSMAPLDGLVDDGAKDKVIRNNEFVTLQKK